MTDYLGSVKLDATGAGIIRMAQNIAGMIWTVQQVAIWTSQIAPAGTVSLWKNGYLSAPSGALSILPSQGPGGKGSGTAAAGLPYIDLQSGDYLEARIQGCTANDTAYATFMYQEQYIGNTVGQPGTPGFAPGFSTGYG